MNEKWLVSLDVSWVVLADAFGQDWGALQLAPVLG